MKRKKILYVVTKSVYGGAQKYVYDLAANLPKDQFEITVAAGGDGLLFKKLQKTGARTIKIPGLQRDINIWKELKSLYHLFKIFREEKPDIIHLNSPKVGCLGAVAARIVSIVSGQKSKVIFTVHGWGFKEDRPPWQKTAIFFLSWFSSLFHGKIILINTADYRTARSFIPKRKLAMIHNGINPIDFLSRTEARAFFSKKIGRQIQNNEILIGTIAELTKNKGLNNLLLALARLNLTKVTVIIVGEGDLRDELKKQIYFLGLQNSVFLPGFISKASHYLRAIDIFVLPSLKEGLPYVIMEAMAAGLPTVATRVGGIPDLIEHGKNGFLIEPKSPAAIATAIGEVLKNSNINLDQNANKIKIKFGLHTMVKKTIKLYDRP